MNDSWCCSDKDAAEEKKENRRVLSEEKLKQLAEYEKIVDKLKTKSKPDTSDSYSKNNTEFKSCNFAASFLYMLPRIPSLEAKNMLQFYMDNLSATEDRKIFKAKMQGLLDFTNSQDVSNAYVEYDQISEMHQKNHWTAITEIVNNLA